MQMPNFGDRVRVQPKAPYQSVPYPVRLRRGVLPRDNKLRKNPLPVLTKSAEVVWDDYWQRRFVRGEIEFVGKAQKTPVEKVPIEKKKDGGDK